jgi:hypothetical protein
MSEAAGADAVLLAKRSRHANRILASPSHWSVEQGVQTFRLFPEHMLQCVSLGLDTADIVRDRDLTTVTDFEAHQCSLSG